MRFGTRRSPLAQAQTDAVLRMRPGTKVLIDSEGDLDLVSALHDMDAPGAFTRSLTAAILDGCIDAAVHSLKDLPLDAPQQAPIVAVLERNDPADVILVRKEVHQPDAPLYLRPGSRIGTSAPRRQAQARDADSSVVCVDVRGNIQTRIGLLDAGVVDGLLMAAAVFERMEVALPQGILEHRLDPARFPGSPGQGVIAVQANARHAAELTSLDHAPTRIAVEAEREVLRALGGGCGLPLGCHVVKGDEWHLFATYGHPEGQTHVHLQGDDPALLVEPAVRALRAPPAPPLASAPPGTAATPQAPAPGTSSTPARPPAPDAKTVALTLSSDRLAPYQQALPGFRLHAWPIIRTEETGVPMPAEGASCAWIAVTSRRAVAAAAKAFASMPNTPRVAAVGAATADALRSRGLPVHVVAADGTGAGLADAVAAFPKPPAPVLVPQAENPGSSLKQGLEACGFEVVEWPVYRTLPDPTPRPACDVVVLCSASAATAYAAGAYAAGPRLLAFGPTTAAAMREAGLPVDGQCLRPGPDGLRQVLEGA